MIIKPDSGLDFRTGGSEIFGSCQIDRPAPVRTCVICRQKDSRRELKRMVIQPIMSSSESSLFLENWEGEEPEDGTVIAVITGKCQVTWDSKAFRQGRGIWVHLGCLPRLNRRRLLAAVKV